MTLRFARWAAVSTREQRRPGKFSIDNQLEHTLEAATLRGWTETAGPFIATQSREKYIDLVEAEAEIVPLQQMLHAARTRQFDVLVVAETDRFRSLLVQVFKRLAQYHVQLYFLNMPIDPVDPDQYNIYKADHVLMMLTMSQMTSSLEISRTRRKWFENMPKRIEQGLPATSIAWGYRKPANAKFDSKAIPEQDPIIAPVIVTMKQLLLKGHSTRQIISYLVENDIKPPKGGPWYAQTVRDVLRNPFYAGKVRFGASRVVMDPLTDRKKRDRSIPEDQIQYGEGRHKPLWDWDTRLLILAEFKRRTKNYRGRANNQFTGLLKCGVCGHALWRQGNGPRGDQRLIWRCSINGNSHGHVNVPHVILLDRIANEIMKVDSTTESTPLDTSEIQRELEDLTSQLERLEDAYLQGEFSLDRYRVRKDQLYGDIKKARDKQISAELAAATRQHQAQALKDLQSIPDLDQWIKTSDPTEVNQRLHFLIDHISISEARIKVVLK